MPAHKRLPIFHANGRLKGNIPSDWLQQNGLNHCTVCSKLISQRYGQACPRCRPALHAPPAQQEARPLVGGCPNRETTCTTRIPLKRRVPKGARRVWSQCLLGALAAVVTFNDARAWTELTALPKMVLAPASSRGGKHTGREWKQRRRGDAPIGWRASEATCGKKRLALQARPSHNRRP